ncbi:hypothetical protein B0T16DRAFT_389562 [Cercophora newfieldiana]|uniref:Heterokaryon incompatibility domain-containing protein n=1 Tax=Cercophora newfieldiana TaxID=92897 RepID=A0AA39YBE8_9PEZI|nr:hypothetical protein B0T16DRAFT_389562 [Cercophora newfieldiana]
MATAGIPGGSDALKLVPAALLDMVKSTDFSPEVLEKMFKDIGASPEKLRAILNLWFVPRFRPSFVPDSTYAVSGLQDVEFLGTLDPPPAQLPYRMFDIETGNLVEFPAIGARGQYCMLSHRWKGLELLLGDIKRARAQDLERTKEAIQMAKIASPGAKLPVSGGARKDDVQLVLEQCRIDIAEQEDTVRELYLVDEPSATPENFSLAKLLDRRLSAKSVENRLEWAKNGEDSARTKLKFAEMESEIFSNLINKGRDNMANSPGEVADGEGSSAVSGVVEDMKAKVTNAKAELQAAAAEYKAALGDIDFFRDRNRVRDALDEMVLRLQRWKSAIKLERVIKEADRIFKTKLFQRREKTYLWTDTCCIDKTNAGELSESLSLMGDWYGHADFTLVQLDTNSSDADAAVDWRLFQEGRGREPEPLSPGLSRGPKKIIHGFEDIAGSKPEWSTRAWTLQELVMSKTTFYLNSEWEDLSRPVESLGYFYHLMPFIALYTQRDTNNVYSFEMSNISDLQAILGEHAPPVELKNVQESIEAAHSSPPSSATGAGEDIASKAWKEAVLVKSAQQLIILLDGLGVRFPKDMALETATSEMSRAVYLAAADLAGDGDGSAKMELFGRLRKKLKKSAAADQHAGMVQSMRKERESEALGAINLLLRHLVDSTLQLVLEDRKYVAKFGLVEKLGAWQEGQRRSGFAAQNVLAASGERVATVATDRAYALMGILGVRFPTFSAEGYAMALARLLDQVIITHNDVSVFNWTGMEMGSPVRGRSLYPSSHVAFSNHEDRGRHYNLLLSSQVQGRMDDVMKTYHEVISVLRQAIDTVKDKQQKDLPFGWIFRIIELVRLSGFYELKSELQSVGKIVGYIVRHCVKKPVPVELSTAATDKEAKDEKDTSSGYLSLNKGFSLPSLPSPTRSLPSPSLSMPGFKMGIGGGKKEDSAADATKKGSKFSAFGKKPSFGLGKQAPEPVVEPAVPPPPPVVAPPAPAAVPASPAAAPPPTIPSKPSWEVLDEAVTRHLEYISHPPKKREELAKAGNGPIPLPSELHDIELGSASAGTDSHAPKNKPGITTRLGPDHDSTICPNPIIVNNAGIEGLFDIQRVIVTMIDHERLRARVAKAVTPRDRISGWCSVSTGFARVVAGFSCEKRLLEQELDAVEGVESRVLMEQGKGKGEKRGARLLRDMVVSPASAAKGDPFEGKGKGEGKEKGEDEGEGKGVDDDVDGETEEERVVSKMIDFIQEPQLQLVAGEWVLARFSGVPGARWFLCHLELGSSPGQYYGHRIATGEIDFSNSTPEPGLVKAWQTYMERKKRKMCYVLDRYLKSRVSAKESEEKLSFGMKTVGDATGRVGAFGFGLPGSPSAAPKAKTDEEATLVEKPDASDSDSDEEGSALDKLLDQGKVAARAFGEFTVLAAVEKFFEMRAESLDRSLSTTVLKRTPKSLRTAKQVMALYRLLPGKYLYFEIEDFTGKLLPIPVKTISSWEALESILADQFKRS